MMMSRLLCPIEIGEEKSKVFFHICIYHVGVGKSGPEVDSGHAKCRTPGEGFIPLKHFNLASGNCELYFCSS